MREERPISGTDGRTALAAPRPDRPIGVFDSGIGGLTVVRALLRELPGRDIVYFGDTARVPYGSKSDAAVTRLTLECAHFLSRFDVGLIVVACNTASSVALPAVARAVDVPVVGVVESGVRAALAATRNGSIGVIGTAATIRSQGYERRLRERNPKLNIVSAACPLFVPLVEEGWIEHDVTRQVAREYLAPLLKAGIDTLILGCTHYPLLKDMLAGVAGPGVTLIDTGEETAMEVRKSFSPGVTSEPQPTEGRRRFFVSDFPSRFEVNGTRFLGRPLGPVTLVPQSDLPWYERSPMEDVP
jgi:glutamate racemase